MKNTVHALMVIISVLGLGGTSIAQEKYPTKPINILIGFPAGGIMDVQARAAAPRLAKELGQNVVVVNKPGAGSTLAVNLVAKSKPDGYTIMNAGLIGIAQAPYMYDVDWKPEDFTYFLGHSTYNTAIVVRFDATWKSFQEWVDYVRKNPGFKYGTYGHLTSVHLLMEWIGKQLGLKLVHIPYPGAAAALTAVLNGDIGLYVSAGSLVPQIRDGKLRTLLQVWGKNVDAAGIKVQSINEVFKNAPLAMFDIPLGFFGPKNIPQSISNNITAALKKATIEDAEFIKVNRTLSADVEYVPPEQVVQRVKNGYISFGQLLNELGFKKNIKKQQIQ